MRPMTSIEVDVQRRVRLQDVRSALVHQMVESFGFPQPHIQAGCPILGSAARLSETVSRAG
jgi:hypothetical protein